MDVAALLEIADTMPEHARAKLLTLIKEREHVTAIQDARKDFLAFAQYVWPEMIVGEHHRRIAKLFNRVAEGDLKRLIINIAPRHGKSEIASYLLPAWFLGLFPNKKIMQASHTADLAVGFGRKVRNLLDTDVYHDIFPETRLRADSKAAGRWNTDKGGDYNALGVGGAAAGKGADIFIIDDSVSEQQALMAETNPEIYDKVYEWYTIGPLQRLQPAGSIIVVETRWSKRDLTGQILKNSAQRGGEEWEVVEFPAILPSGRALWPEFWDIEELEAKRREMPAHRWEAQYQQSPTSEVSAIVKREWWRVWPHDEPPKCEFTLMSWDTAFEKHNRADYTACTLWGVFFHDDPESGTSNANIILLNAFRDRLEFPALKKRAIEQYRTWQPDTMIVEKKASGAPLIYELRAMGIPVQEYTPSRGQDKIARLNAVADLFASGIVWVPNRHWADEVINEVAEFPAGEHDDFVDSTSLALMRFRLGGFVRTTLDEDETHYKHKRLAQVARPYY